MVVVGLGDRFCDDVLIELNRKRAWAYVGYRGVDDIQRSNKKIRSCNKRLRNDQQSRNKAIKKTRQSTLVTSLWAYIKNKTDLNRLSY